MADTVSIQKISQARRLLAEANSLDDIMQIRDIAEAARVYAQAARLGLESQNEAAEIKLRAERKAGELLARMPKADGGVATRARLHRATESQPPTYAELGIEKTQAHRWQTVATMPEDDFEEHIAKVKSSGQEITTSDLYRKIRNIEREHMHAEKKSQPFPDGKYSVIYADPPWKYDNSGFDQSAEEHYPTMSIEEIKSLDVQTLAGEPCVLFLWATSPLLPEAIEVIKSWGFEYRASRVWIKERAPGIGWWVKTKHEFLLIATKNGNAHPDIKLDSIIHGENKIHSRKPENVYTDIEACYSGNKIELFARERRDGWEAWGNEPAIIG